MATYKIKSVSNKDEWESLLLLNENEVKNFERVKTSVKQKLLTDIEYARKTVTKVISPRTDLLDEFIIEKSWNVFQADLLQYYYKVIENAENLQKNLLPRIELLIQEKKSSKTKLIECKDKFHFTMMNYKDKVEKTRKEILDRNKAFIKLTKDPNQRLKAAEKIDKIQQAHNSYLIALTEYNEFVETHTTILLPNLLKAYQEIQENLLLEYKNILTEFFNFTNSANENYAMLFEHISKQINEINPHDDYNIDFPLSETKTKKPDSLKFIENKLSYDQEIINLANGYTDIIEIIPNKLFSNLSSKIEIGQKRNEIDSFLRSIEAKLLELQANLKLTENEPESYTKYIQIINLTREIEENNTIKNFLNKVVRILYGMNPSVRASIRRPRSTKPVEIDESVDYLNATNENEDVSIDHSKSLEEQPWYHGRIIIDELERLLQKKGDFFIRNINEKITEDDQEKKLTPYKIAVMTDTISNIDIYQHQETGLYGIEELAFEKISELVESLVMQSKSGGSQKSILFLNPIPKRYCEISHSDIQILCEIGSGQFGQVFKGIYRKRIEVAIKSCKESVPEDEKKSFVFEGKFLQKFEHKNIVKFIGIAIDQDPIYLVMELVKGGSLVSYLRNALENQNLLEIRSMLKLSRDCAEGMLYLERNNVVHRDLAARNCLLDEEKFLLKIADFGLAKQIDDDKVYYTLTTRKLVPLRWAALESLRKSEISSQSDVWGFGVTVWEIFSYAKKPYENIAADDLLKFLEDGNRLEKPDCCPDNIYQELLLNCWLENKNDRPNFKKILEIIDSLMNSVYLN